MTTRKIGLLIGGTEEDGPPRWRCSSGASTQSSPCPMVSLARRRGAGARASLRSARGHSLRRGGRPAGSLAGQPPRVVEEGGTVQPRLSAQQPLHLPEHGEALGLRRHDAPGLHVPKTWLVPLKSYPDRDGYQETANRYYDWFDLPASRPEFGYPLYMKPFDGGGWRGVSRIDNEWELMRAYDASGQTMMHLQTALEGFDVFVPHAGHWAAGAADALRPSQPIHARYVIEQDFLSPEKRLEIIRHHQGDQRLLPLGDQLVRGDPQGRGRLQPIDYANACPDMHLFSLHVNFPWAVKSLLAWTSFCLATDRRMKLDMNTADYSRSPTRGPYDEKLAAYEALADRYFDTERFLGSAPWS